MSHLFLVAHGRSGHLALAREGLGAGNVNTLSWLRGLVTVGVEIHACAVASLIPIHVTTVPDGIGGNSSWVARPGDLDPYWQTPGVPTLRQGLVDRNITAPTGRVVRQGRGVQFLLALARAIGVQVTGGVNVQMPDSAWRFEGPTVTALPGGELTLRIPPNDTTFGPGTAGTHEIP